MTPESLLQQYESALATQQWENVAPFFHDSACVTFANGTFKGKAEIRAVFEQNFRSIEDENYSISNVHWAYRTQIMAVALYEFRWQGILDGEPTSGGGRGTSVLVNEAGRWWIVSEHLGPFAED